VQITCPDCTKSTCSVSPEHVSSTFGVVKKPHKPAGRFPPVLGSGSAGVPHVYAFTSAKNVKVDQVRNTLTKATKKALGQCHKTFFKKKILIPIYKR